MGLLTATLSPRGLKLNDPPHIFRPLPGLAGGSARSWMGYKVLGTGLGGPMRITALSTKGQAAGLVETPGADPAG